MVIEVADNLKWESPTIFYSQDQDIILWQSFKSHGFIQPRFVKIPEFASDQQLLKILLNVKHKRVSATLNIILFVHQWHITEKFIQSIISNFSHIIYIFRIFCTYPLVLGCNWTHSQLGLFNPQYANPWNNTLLSCQYVRHLAS